MIQLNVDYLQRLSTPVSIHFYCFTSRKSVLFACFIVGTSNLMCIAFKLIFELSCWCCSCCCCCCCCLYCCWCLRCLSYSSVLMLFLYGFYELFIAIFNARVRVWPGQLPMLSREGQQLATVCCCATNFIATLLH